MIPGVVATGIPQLFGGPATAHTHLGAPQDGGTLPDSAPSHGQPVGPGTSGPACLASVTAPPTTLTKTKRLTGTCLSDLAGTGQGHGSARMKGATGLPGGPSGQQGSCASVPPGDRRLTPTLHPRIGTPSPTPPSLRDKIAPCLRESRIWTTRRQLPSILPSWS